MTRLSLLTAVLATTLLLAAPTAPALAKHVDCDAVHATINTELEASCPCDGFSSHGTFVRCITRQLRDMAACQVGSDGGRACGPVPRECVGKIRRVASRSACGRAGAVTCCLAKQHDCTGDATPGDGLKQGLCTGTKRRCDVLADCLIPKCQLTTSADHCKLAGGTIGQGKNCRTACR